MTRISFLTSSPPYVLASFSQREQHGLSRRSICDGLELRVLPTERLGRLHFRSLQDVDELQRIDDGLSLKVIVGHPKRPPSPPRNFAAPRHPPRKLFAGVEMG